MTKGDRDKLRAELAGKAMAAHIGRGHLAARKEDIVRWAVAYADALMAELGIKGEDKGYDRRDYPDGMEG